MSDRSKRLLVIEDNEPAYPDPIQVNKGDVLLVGEEDDEYPGWIWCENKSGKQGWVPDDCIESAGDVSVAKYDYSAVELRAHAGEQLSLLESKYGWARCSNNTGERGWVPLTKLREG